MRPKPDPAPVEAVATEAPPREAALRPSSPEAPPLPAPVYDDDEPGGFDEETNNRYEEIKRGGARTHISELQQMTMPHLLKTAKEEGLTEYTGLKKQDLIFKILKERVKQNGLMFGEGTLEVLPDGEFLPPWQFNTCETSIRVSIVSHYKNRHVVIGRCAHLTQPQQIHIEQGRGQCQARSLCERGCPYGGYFSSNSSTLPWAKKQETSA